MTSDGDLEWSRTSDGDVIVRDHQDRYGIGFTAGDAYKDYKRRQGHANFPLDLGDPKYGR